MKQGFIVFLDTNYHHFMHTVSGISARDATVWRGISSAADLAAPHQEFLYPLCSPLIDSATWPKHPDGADFPAEREHAETSRVGAADMVVDARPQFHFL